MYCFDLMMDSVIYCLLTVWMMELMTMKFVMMKEVQKWAKQNLREIGSLARPPGASACLRAVTEEVTA